MISYKASTGRRIVVDVSTEIAEEQESNWLPRCSSSVAMVRSRMPRVTALFKARKLNGEKWNEDPD